MSKMDADYIIVGAGIGGASIAYWLARSARVIVLEREAHAGYHSTGRSAALYMASYGPEQVRALTCASREFFVQPPAGFCEHDLLTSRGALVFAQRGQEAALDAHEAIVRSTSEGVERLTAAETLLRVPVLQADELLGAVLENDASDIDVDGLLQGFLRGARADGGRVIYDTQISGLQRVAGGWEIATNNGVFRAPVLVNAAGAWGKSVV